tara:strand:+ start:525 stop:674 length:150 start_codon:yes stop_codon:yes gene_type:complete
MRDVSMAEAIIHVVLMTSMTIRRRGAKRNFLALFYFSPRAFWPEITSLT